MKRGLKLLLLLTGWLALFCLCCCGSLEKKLTVLEAEIAPSAAPAPEELSRYWYGYWFISDAQDDWKPLDGYSWDCCAELSAGGEGFSLLLWDEDMSKEYYLAKVNFTVSGESYFCSGGEFLDITLGPGAMSIKCRDDQGVLLQLSGAYSDGSTGSFCYTMYLRPWGDEWPQGSGRPYYYERWYLPLIEAGEEPPDVIRPYE